jgi:hypothetical protein
VSRSEEKERRGKKKRYTIEVKNKKEAEPIKNLGVLDTT